MLFVKYDIHATVDEVLESLNDNNAIIEAEKIDVSSGKPRLHVRKNGDSLKIQCEIADAPTKDRDFKLGTTFRGSIKESDGVTRIRGVILTAPIYHAILLILFGYFIYQCISLGGISVVPICLIVFDVFMFWREFKKQGIIKRFIFRALKLTYQKKNPKSK